jgi:hypothetical protein
MKCDIKRNTSMKCDIKHNTSKSKKANVAHIIVAKITAREVLAHPAQIEDRCGRPKPWRSWRVETRAPSKKSTRTTVLAQKTWNLRSAETGNK